jgi:PadR family transcriptional regulator, regulatory protein PadR
MATKKTNPDFLNGVPELLILRVLDQRPMHGYDLVQTIRQADEMLGSCDVRTPGLPELR